MITTFNLMFDIEWMNKAEDYDDFFDFFIKPDFFYGEVSIETDEGGVEVVPFATSTWICEAYMCIYMLIDENWERFWIEEEYLPERLQDCFEEDGYMEDIILESVDDVMKTCTLNDVATENDKKTIVTPKKKGKPHQKPRRKDNSRITKTVAKERKENRIKAKERRGEQYWQLRNPLKNSGKGLWTIVPIDPWKLKIRREMRLEAFTKEMLKDY